jgi:sn-glycerol 3-phosphate transport system substrate-binding protein
MCAAALVLAACGGDDDGGDGAADTTPASEPGATAPAGTGDADTAPVDTEAPAADLPPCPLDALDEADGPVEVVVWHTQVAEPLDALTALADRYNSSQDRVRVRLESQGSAYGELKRKFQATLQTPGDLPALIMFDDTATQEMADSGFVLPAQSCFDAAGVDLGQFASVATSYYTIDGVMWPVSANLGGILLFYNRDHFEAAGLDPDDPPQTLAEVRAAAEAIAAAGVAERPVAHELSSWKTEFWLTGAGSSIVDNDNGRGSGETTAATLSDNPEALELFTWFDDMQEDGLLEPIPSTDGQIDQYLALATQRSSMLIESSSAATSVEAFLGGQLDPDVLGGTTPSPSGLDITASGFPGLVPGSQTQMGGAAWYLLNTTAPEVQAAAFDFMTFMNSPEAQLEMLTVGSYLPWLTELVDDPAAAEFFDASMSGQWLEIAARQIDAIDPDFPGPLIGPYDPDMREAIERAQDALLLGSATPQEALDQAQAEIDELLEQYASF